MDDLIHSFIAHRTLGGFRITRADWEAMPWADACYLMEMTSSYNANRPR